MARKLRFLTFPQLLNKYKKQGYTDKQASTKAHSYIAKLEEQENASSSESEEEEEHSHSVITKELIKMKTIIGHLENKYKHKDILLLLKYIDKVINKFK
jgi:hypothetical protein